MHQHSKDFPDSFFRVAVKGLCVRDGKLLMQRDTVRPERPVWDLPGGGLDFGETFEQGLRREVREENGLEVAWLADTPTYTWQYRSENSRGMDWYHVVLLGFRFELTSLDFTQSDECQEMRFFSLEDIQAETTLNGQMRHMKELFNPTDFP